MIWETRDLPQVLNTQGDQGAHTQEVRLSEALTKALPDDLELSSNKEQARNTAWHPCEEIDRFNDQAFIEYLKQ